MSTEDDKLQQAAGRYCLALMEERKLFDEIEILARNNEHDFKYSTPHPDDGVAAIKLTEAQYAASCRRLDAFNDYVAARGPRSR